MLIRVRTVHHELHDRLIAAVEHPLQTHGVRDANGCAREVNAPLRSARVRRFDSPWRNAPDQTRQSPGFLDHLGAAVPNADCRAIAAVWFVEQDYLVSDERLPLLDGHGEEHLRRLNDQHLALRKKNMRAIMISRWSWVSHLFDAFSPQSAP